MVILGIVLVLVALVLGAALLVGTSAPEVAGQEIDIQLLDAVTINLDPLTLVIAGMVTMFLLWLGLVLIKTTLTRNAKQRRARKQQETAARERRSPDEWEGREHQDQGRRAVESESPPPGGPGGHGGWSEHPAGAPGPTPPSGREGGAGATQRIRREDLPSDATRPIAREDATRPISPDDATRPIRPGDDPRR